MRMRKKRAARMMKKKGGTSWLARECKDIDYVSMGSLMESRTDQIKPPNKAKAAEPRAGSCLCNCNS